MSGPSDRQLARLFAWAVVLYFTAHWGLRAALGGSFEMDEAEMILHAQDFRLGYGPQLPLYNWWQAGWFSLFGVNAFAIAGAKNVMIAATYLAVFAAFARFLPQRLAVFGALSLMLVPNILWEGQRANTHSTAMCLMMAVFLWTLAGCLHTGRWRDYLVLGMALGLGALSKYNFALYAGPLVLAGILQPRTRAAFLKPRLLAALGVAFALIALPYLWIWTHAEAAMGSARKLYQPGAVDGVPVWLSGLGEYGAALAAGLGVVALAAGAMRWRGRATPEKLAPQADAFIALMWGGFAISVLAGVLGVLLAGVSTLQVRWLLPQFMLGAPVLMIWGVRHLGARGRVWLLACVALLGGLALAAMADLRLRGAGSDSLRVDLLAQEIEARVYGPPQIRADFYYAGNLRFHRPNWHYTRQAPVPGAEIVLISGRGRDRLRQHGGFKRLARMHELAGIYMVRIPHRFAPQTTRAVTFAVFRPR